MAKMVKIVGKIFLICFLAQIVTFLRASIALEVRSDSTIPNQVIIGQPFFLEVTIKDISGAIPHITINGIEKFNPKETGSFRSNVNGKVTARYSYQLRINKLGTYTLGPASIDYQNQTIVSNTAQITVVQDMHAPSSNNSNHQSEYKAFLRLIIDETSVVIGQAIHCTLRFYYQDPSLSLNNVTMPELPAFEIKEVGKLQTGITDYNGITYRYAEWKWEMFPLQAGEFTIPAYNADYEIPSKDNGMLGSFFMLINRSERKRVYSNAITLKVNPLPPYTEPIKAVGVFERFTADITPNVIKEGEAMVLGLEIEGSGNMHTLEIPILNIPKELKYYPSNTTILKSEHADESSKKRFEFIVQGLESGDFQIPEQTFTYFNTEKHEYVTMYSSTLSVSIMPNPINAKKDLLQSSIAPSLTTHKEDSDILFFNTKGQWHTQNHLAPLPWWLFQCLSLLIFFYMCYPFFLNYWIFFAQKSRFLTRRRLLKQAHKKISLCRANNDTQQLYAIFISLSQEVEKLYGINSIEEIIPQDKKKEWLMFLDTITRAAYTQVSIENYELNETALIWIKYLEKII